MSQQNDFFYPLRGDIVQRLPEFNHYLTSEHHEHQRTRIYNRATVDYTAAVDHSRAVVNTSTTGWC